MRGYSIRRVIQNPNEDKARSSVWEIYKRLFGYVWQHKLYLFLAIIAVVVVALLQFIIPQITRIVIDDIIPAAQFNYLWWVAISIILLALFLGLFNFFSSYLMSIVGQKTIYDIRNKLYRHLQNLSMSFFDNRRTGELMSRITNDVNTLQQLITSGVVEIFKDLFVFIVILAYLFYAEWTMTTLIVVTFPLMIWATNKFAGRIRGAYRDVQVQAANVNDHLQETLSSIKLIKSFTNEKYETKRFKDRNKKNMSANITAVKYWATYAPVIDVLNHLGLVVILVYGAWQVMQGNLAVGELVAFTMYLRMLQQPIRRFTRVINVIQQAAAASERIFEILDTHPDIVEKKDAVDLPELQGHIMLENVTFAYDEKSKVLDSLSLEIEPGQTVALVGPSGAGKSTVTNLIARFYDPNEGRILFDQYDIRDVTISSLRGQIGIVSQDILLLNGTIRENIAYGKPEATEEEIIAAAKIANAHQFISRFADGYDSSIGERGIKLSGGQRQRISIARAVLKDPRFLILDEATSSLDSESEHLIQEALSKLLRNRTSLVIAHRLSTIQNADVIVVLDDGKIVEMGSHEELLDKRGAYAYLYSLQFPQEEEDTKTS